jgi:hypothetical protein
MIDRVLKFYPQRSRVGDYIDAVLVFEPERAAGGASV